MKILIKRRRKEKEKKAVASVDGRTMLKTTRFWKIRTLSLLPRKTISTLIRQSLQSGSTFLHHQQRQ